MHTCTKTTDTTDEGKTLSNDLDPLVSKAGASLGRVWCYSLSFFPEAPFICLANKKFITLQSVIG